MDRSTCDAYVYEAFCKVVDQSFKLVGIPMEFLDFTWSPASWEVVKVEIKASIGVDLVNIDGIKRLPALQNAVWDLVTKQEKA